MTMLIIACALGGVFFGGAGYLILSILEMPGAGTTALAAGLMFFSLTAMAMYTLMGKNEAVNEQLDTIESTFPVKYLCRVNAEIKGRKFGRLYIFGDRFLLMSVMKKNIIAEHLPYNDVHKLDYQRHKSAKALDLIISMKNGAEHFVTVLNSDEVVKTLTDVGWSFPTE